MRLIRINNDFLLHKNKDYREPKISNQLLLFISNNGTMERIELIDFMRKRKISLRGFNQLNLDPISLSISGNGQTLAFIIDQSGKNELFIYRIRQDKIQRIPIIPNGIPERISLDGLGKKAAVEIRRNGQLNIEIIKI